MRPTHFAINTSDVEVTKDFYRSVFDWTFRDIGVPGFVQVLDGENAMGAIQERRALVENPTLGFECTFGVSNVEETQHRVEAAGGRVLMGPETIPGVGQLLAFEDPGGNPVLAMQYDVREVRDPFQAKRGTSWDSSGPNTN